MPFQIPDLSQFNGIDPTTGGYAVANDAGKLIGQALAEFDARAKSPRTDIWGQPLKEDTAPALKAELIDPILTRFGMSNFGMPAAALAPKTYHVAPGTEVVQVNPRTGETTKVYQAAPKPQVAVKESQVKVPVSFDILGKPSSFLQATPSQIRDSIASGTIPSSQVATNQALQFYNNLAPAGAANTFKASVEAGKRMATESMTPSAFIGTPGVTPPITLNLPTGNPAGGTQGAGGGKKRYKFNPETGTIE